MTPLWKNCHDVAKWQNEKTTKCCWLWCTIENWWEMAQDTVSTDVAFSVHMWQWGSAAAAAEAERKKVCSMWRIEWDSKQQQQKEHAPSWPLSHALVVCAMQLHFEFTCVCVQWVQPPQVRALLVMEVQSCLDNQGRESVAKWWSRQCNCVPKAKR